MMKKISILIPCYNEALNIELMYEAVSKQMVNMFKYDYEIIFADNDSKDNSQEILRKIAKNDVKVKVILNQTNFGPDRSVVNLYKNASGDCIIGIPCDFQEPPELIPVLIEQWEKGFDVVLGQKNKSKENFIKYNLRTAYYNIIESFSDYKTLKHVTGFGLIDKKVMDILLITQIQDPEYALRNLITEYGFNIKLLPYEQNKRERGKSSYSLYKYFHFAINSLCSTSIKPLHIMTLLGFFISICCFIVALVYFIYKLIFWNEFSVGIAPVAIGLFFVSGVQLFCIGMLGEYIGILVRRVTRKSLVVEKEKINFDSEQETENENETV